MSEASSRARRRRMKVWVVALLALSVVLFFLVRIEPASQVVRLKDGSSFRIRQVTYGTNHVFVGARAAFLSLILTDFATYTLLKTIAHISDLRFGREDPEVVVGLKEDLDSQRPSLVAVCGDLTHRAGQGQFKKVRNFLSSLAAPVLSVMGDRDVPLYNPVARFCYPHERFRRTVTRSLAPIHLDDEMTVYGINTARRWKASGGHIGFDQINSIKSRICPTPEGRYRVLVTHHPFIAPSGHEKRGIDYMGRWRHAVGVLDFSLVDLTLAGHLPRGMTSYSQPFRRDASFVLAQAGAATARLPRGEVNAYNMVVLADERIEVRTRVWGGKAFEESERVTYWLDDGDWVKAV